MSAGRRGARVVEWDGLENRCTGNRTVGSNPTLSASVSISFFKLLGSAVLSANSGREAVARHTGLPPRSGRRTMPNGAKVSAL